VWRWLILFAGCDKLLSLDDITPPPDAPPGLDCKRDDPTAFFCADFDEMMAVSYGDGVQTNVPQGTPPITAATMQPYASPPYALWIDATKATMGRYDLEYSNNASVKKIHAELDIRIDGPIANTVELVEVGIDNTTGTSCHFQLQAHSDQTMRVRWYHCIGTMTQNPETTFFGSIPSDFQHYALDFDIGSGMASVTLAGTPTPDPLPLFGAGGMPMADVGVFYIGAPGGPLIAFDNVVVTVAP
jgi:hypothetical protein